MRVCPRSMALKSGTPRLRSSSPPTSLRCATQGRISSARAAGRTLNSCGPSLRFEGIRSKEGLEGVSIPMNSRERVLAMCDHRPVDRIPFMPITMMFAADQIGVPYGRYVSDYGLLVEAQLVTAERFDIDLVSCISDPAREAADLGAPVRFFSDQPPAFVESDSLLQDKSVLASLKIPDPLSGGRM